MQPALGLQRRHSGQRRDVRRCAHFKELSRLRQAVKSTATTADPSDPSALEEGLSRLKQQWAAADAAPRKPKRNTTSLGKGVRRIGNVTEYDFTVIDADGDDPAYDYADDEDGGGGGLDETSVSREARYFDTAQINVRSGDGGAGCCAFLREKFVARGGPAGGNGGNGGSVWVVADEGRNSLTSFRNQVHWKAEGGARGQGKSQHGANAKDLFIPVPLGTIVREKDAEEGAPPLAELLEHGERALVVLGGNGGRGNASFKTSQNRAPTLAETGEAGTEMWLQLELKLVADVGIIGVPNAGKSTLLSRLSSAKPKVADYSFTTLVPNIGVCELDYATTVFADVPGLIEGAADGRGLGHEFLRHVSRARTLVHVLDGTSRDPVYDYKAIRIELELFGMGLSDMPQIVAYNKVDVPDSGEYADDVAELLECECGVPRASIMPISAASGQGVTDLVRAVRRMLEAAPDRSDERNTDALNVRFKAKSATDAARLADYAVEADLAAERTWYVTGVALERFAQMTNWRFYEATLRFQRVLKRIGLWADLEARGVQDGDTVVIGGSAFVWSSDQSEQKLFDAWSQSAPANVRGSARWPHASG